MGKASCQNHCCKCSSQLRPSGLVMQMTHFAMTRWKDVNGPMNMSRWWQLHLTRPSMPCIQHSLLWPPSRAMFVSIFLCFVDWSEPVIWDVHSRCLLSLRWSFQSFISVLLGHSMQRHALKFNGKTDASQDQNDAIFQPGFWLGAQPHNVLRRGKMSHPFGQQWTAWPEH